MATDSETIKKSLSALYDKVGDTASKEEQMINVSRGLISKLIEPLYTQMGLKELKEPAQLLDNACGTGVLTQELQRIFPREILEKSSFLCADGADGMVGLVERRVVKEGWVNTEVKKLDAMNTGLPDNSFTHVGLGLALHIIPRPDEVLADSKRILKPGGIFGATTFHHSNTFWVPDVRAAFSSFPFPAPFPSKLPMQLHDQGDWTDETWIEGHMKEQGFKEVKVTTNPGKFRVENVEEFMRSFSMMLSWVMSTWWDEETREKHSVEEVRGLLRGFLEEKYGEEGWDIEWNVICITGRV